MTASTTIPNLSETEAGLMMAAATSTARPLTETEQTAATADLDTDPTGRSDLAAQAAELLDAAAYESETYDRAGNNVIHERARSGENATANRAHAAVLLQLDQAESLARIATVLERARLDTVGNELARLPRVLETSSYELGESLSDLVSGIELVAARIDTASEVAVDIRSELAELSGVAAGQELAIHGLAQAVAARTEAENDDSIRVSQLAAGAAKFSAFLLLTAGVLSYKGSDWHVASWLPGAAALYGGGLLLVAVLLAVVPLFVARFGNGHQDDDHQSDTASELGFVGGQMVPGGTGSGKAGRGSGSQEALWTGRFSAAEVGLLPVIVDEEPRDVELFVEAYDLGQLPYPAYAEPDWNDEAVRSERIAAAIAGDENALFDVEVRFEQLGQPLDLAERQMAMGLRVPDFNDEAIRTYWIDAAIAGDVFALELIEAWFEQNGQPLRSLTAAGL